MSVTELVEKPTETPEKQKPLWHYEHPQHPKHHWCDPSKPGKPIVPGEDHTRCEACKYLLELYGPVGWLRLRAGLPG